MPKDEEAAPAASSEVPHTRIRSIDDPAVVEIKGVPVYRAFTIEHVNSPDWPCDIALSVEVDAESGPVAVGLRTLQRGAGPVVSVGTGYSLFIKSRPLRRWIEQAMLSGAAAVARSRFSSDARTSDVTEAVVEAQSGVRKAARTRRKNRVNDELLDRVAGIYNAAVTNGGYPLRAIMRAEDVSLSTATRYARWAREGGRRMPSPKTAATSKGKS